jgi:hypothetical protein
MNFKSTLLQRRAVQSDTGGVIANGPFRVRLTTFGSKLIYSERDHKLTLPVEYGLDRSCNIGASLIRRWDDSSEQFRKDQISAIDKNIFLALDHMHVKYTNIR